MRRSRTRQRDRVRRDDAPRPAKVSPSGPSSAAAAAVEVKRVPRRSRGLWALAIAGPLALVLVLLLGRLREPAPRQAPPVAATPAVWALPETEAERRALAQARDRHGVEQLGDYYLGADRPFAAVWQFQEALSGEAARTAGAPMALTLRLAAALQQGRWYLPAGRLLEPLAVGAPGNETARQQLAAVYLATGRPERAVRLLISGAGGFPGSAGPTAAVARLLPAQLLELGKACQAAGMSASARQAYERAMRVSPHNPEAPLRLGRLLLRNGQAGEAAALFRLTSRLDPHDPRFPDYLGRALMRLGGTQNREDAGRSFTAATMMAPRLSRDTGTGSARWINVPSPSSPCRLSPHPYIVPLSSGAIAKL